MHFPAIWNSWPENRFYNVLLIIVSETPLDIFQSALYSNSTDSIS